MQPTYKGDYIPSILLRCYGTLRRGCFAKVCFGYLHLNLKGLRALAAGSPWTKNFQSALILYSSYELLYRTLRLSFTEMFLHMHSYTKSNFTNPVERHNLWRFSQRDGRGWWVDGAFELLLRYQDCADKVPHYCGTTNFQVVDVVIRSCVRDTEW